MAGKSGDPSAGSLYTPMKLTLQRGRTIGVSIMGEMFVAGAHECFTLERSGVAIPAGIYRVDLYQSLHFNRLMPILVDVPGRSDILIHWGNYPQNSEGCILIGEQQDLSIGEIFNTRAEFDELFPIIEAAVRTEGCSIEILDPHSTP